MVMGKIYLESKQREALCKLSGGVSIDQRRYLNGKVSTTVYTKSGPKGGGVYSLAKNGNLNLLVEG